MMNLLCLQGFNNYYNRVIKKYSDVNEYLQWVDDNNKFYDIKPGINFNPNDSVNTEQVVNWENSWNPDYIVIYDDFTPNEVNSRWFVVESIRLRGNQYKLLLRRDLIADFYKDVIDAPCFIEKATLLANDPFIFNKEDIGFNQIKKKELQLKDRTNTAWIVGYYDKSVAQENPDSFNIEIPIGDQPFDISVPTTLENWEFYQATVKSPVNGGTLKIRTRVPGANQIRSYILYPWMPYANKYIDATIASGNETSLNQSTGTPVSPDELYNKVIKTNNQFNTLFNTHFGGGTSQDTVNRLLSFDDKTVRFSDGQGGFKFYKVSIIENKMSVSTQSITTGALYTNLYNTIRVAYEGSWANAAANQFSFEGNATYDEYTIAISETAENTTKVQIKATANELTDAPYSMFVLPYDDVVIDGVEYSSANNLRIATKLALSKAVYDLQLLPYCPILKLISQTDGSLTLDNLIIDQDYSLIQNNLVPAQTLGFIFYPQKSSFTFDIFLDEPINPENIKMSNECDMWRLVSPNYSGQFEFNAAKNGGVNKFNVDCTYIPYQPYIHINPDFGLLYGEDFNDARGLICSGEFSLPRLEDAWENYKLQNKNFQEIFARQIDNMEIQQKYQRIQDIVGAGVGTITGAVSGAFMGKAGGMGTIAGGIIGGIGSAVGGIADVQINDILRNEAIDYTKDNFGYQLGNIKAMPQSLTKNTAYTYNNKIFPILEYYSCTDEEKIALANKLAYNGMTVMRIGKISEFINNTWSYSYTVDGETFEISSKGYIKGQLIRFNTIDDDFHIVKEISNEIYKGVYL